MKISIDVEVSPEEMRRLLGLPDFSPAQDLIVERVTRQIEKGLDGQLLSGMMKTVISGGMQGLEAYQKLVSGLLNSAARSARGKADKGSDVSADATGGSSSER